MYAQIKQDFKTAIAARAIGEHLVFGYLGQPGSGKTQMIHQVAEEFGYEVWSGFNISAASPMDVAIKMPKGDLFQTLPSDDFPWSSLVLDRKILLFIDEVTNGTSDTIKAIQRLVNERKLGEHTLGVNVIVFLAGNRQSDKAGSGNLSTAMYNRVTWRDWTWDSKDSDSAVTYLASKHLISDQARELKALLLGYFAHKPMTTNDFSEALKQLGKAPYVQWCSPRSLEALIVRSVCADYTLPSILDAAGDIGLGRATELIGFASLLGKLPSYDTVVKSPKEARLPDEVDSQYAMTSMLAVRVRPADFGKVWQYMSRFEELTMKVVFLKLALKTEGIKDCDDYKAVFAANPELVKAVLSV